MPKHKFVRAATLFVGVVLLLGLAVRVYALNPTHNGRIIYNNYDSDTGHYNIFSMAADGSDKKVIIASPTGKGMWNPQVSTDGQKIAYEIEDNDGDPYLSALALADVDGQHQTIIKTFISDLVSKIAWSPDNMRLAYVTYNSDTSQQIVHIINVDGTNNQTVNIQDLAVDSIVRSVAWSIDNKLLYSMDAHLFASDLDGTNATELTAETGWVDATILSAGWSPDGSKIVFSAYGCVGGGGCIVTANADGTNKHVVTSDPSITNSCGDPQYNNAGFSPDGTKIVYSNTPACG